MRYLLTIITCLLIFSTLDAHAQVRSYSWKSLSGPYGGITYQLVYDREDRLFAATLGGVFRSLDSGRTWMAVNNGIPTYTVTSVALDSSGGVLASALGLYRSTDGGDNWTRIDNLGMYGASGYGGITVEPESKAIFYGAGRGLQRTSDFGVTWQLVDSTLYPYRLHSKAGAIYGLYGNDCYRFRPEVNYTAEKLKIADSIKLVPMVVPGRNTYLFAPTGTGGLFRSTDGGSTWEKIDSGITGASVSVIVASPTGTLLAATSAGMHRSTDNGNSWSYVSKDGISPGGGVIISDSVIVLTNSPGIRLSTNGMRTYTEHYHGMKGLPVYALATDNYGGIFTVTGSAYRSIDGGVTWAKALSGLPSISVVSPEISAAPNGSLFLCNRSSTRSTIYRSTDRGLVWTTAGDLGQRAQTSLLTGANGLVLVGMSDGTIQRSINSGSQWSSISLSNRYITAFAADSVGGLWAATDTLIFHSTSRGAQWEQVAQLSGTRALAVGRGGRLFAASVVDTQIIVRSSTDNGDTWKSTLLVPTTPRVFTSVDVSGIVAADSGRIVVGTTYTGVFISRDSGETWEQTVDGLPLSSITTVALSSAGSIIIGTAGPGLFELQEQFGLSVDEPQDKLLPPVETRLTLPYPNPFQNTILIPYDIAHDSHAVIEVFNSVGERVEQLVDEDKKVGRYSITWEAPYQANGYYFVRLRADGVSMALPVVMMR
jgi:photosystem II stability/assembly factor-like uncharacterized protein